jgi:hypothetical protein
MRVWLYGLLIEPFAGINILTKDRSPEWRNLGWRLAARMADVRQQVT